MATKEPSPFVVRAPIRRLVVGGLLSAFLVGGALGCHHRQRSALRPRYIGPTTTVIAPASSAAQPCPPGSPCDTAGTSVVKPGFDEPTILSPGSGRVIPTDPGVRPSTTPPAPDGLPANEPQLEEIPAPGAARGGESYRTPTVSPPTSQRSRPRPYWGADPSADNRSAPSAATRDPLSERVAALVDDPADLLQPPKADRRWQFIVLHHSAHPSGSYAQIDRDHRQVKGFSGCGYHFVVGNGSESPDGRIEVARRWSEQKAGAHCRDGKHPDVNDYGIGICLVGDLDEGPPTARQVESARTLVAYLRERYAIPVANVGTHAQLATGPTDCPGRHFPPTIVRASADRRPVR